MPAELIQLSRWVCWKDKKVPYIATALNSKASVTDEGTWATFEQTKTAYEEGGYEGVGFVLNGDGIVGNADFSFISVNFWLSGDSCSGAANAHGPRSRVSVKELRRQGLGQLALADLNGDGWVDQQDIQTLLENGLEQGRVTVTKPGRIQVPRW